MTQTYPRLVIKEITKEQIFKSGKDCLPEGRSLTMISFYA